MINLAVNGMDAIDDCDTGPRNLKIRTRRNAKSETAEVAVADSRKGISEENLTSVFDAFFTTKPQGTGLGLPIAPHDHADLRRDDLGREPRSQRGVLFQASISQSLKLVDFICVGASKIEPRGGVLESSDEEERAVLRG